MDFFVPDRSNRPTDTGDPSGGTTEIGTDRTKTLELADGRIAVVESARVDDFTCVYYYFDATGLEDATDDELAELMRASGVNWAPRREEVQVGVGSTKTKDAQEREIWEFQITYWE